MPQARLNIEGEIGRYMRAIVDLKSHLNTLSLIGRLPPELLSAILICGAMDDYYSAGLYQSNGLPWIRLAHVCRHFRAVALATPPFWSYLRMTKSQTFAELLTLSKRAPLHVSAHISHPTREDRLLGLDALLQHFHHLQELRINGPIKVIRAFCAKARPGFDVLESLELSGPSAHSMSYHSYDSGPLTVVPIIASDSGLPPRLRSLELRNLPIHWTDLVFSSPRLTTLVVAGLDPSTVRGSGAPDVGSFDELFATLEALSSRLEVLELEYAIPKDGLPTTGSPAELPRPSRSIQFLSIKDIRLVGDGLRIAHMLNHLSLPSAVSLHLKTRSHVGVKELTKSLAAHFSDKSPLLSLRISSYGLDPLTLFGWTQPGKSSGQDPTLRVAFGSGIAPNLLGAVLQGCGPLFTRVQELKLYGIFDLPRWMNVFARFPSVRTLIAEEHPYGDFFPALMTLRHIPDGRVFAALPVLRVLDLSGFRFSRPKEALVPFNDLLDWAMFRCNYGIPVDTIRLSECRYALEELIEKLEEVVVDVQWDDDEAESTSEEEEEEESEEAEDTEEEFYGGQHRFYGREPW